jgi:thiol-disulfide isomerase/thioredoxin
VFSILHTRLGKKATELVGETVDGNKFDLSDHQDKVVIVNFWAIWCAPCVAAIENEKDLVNEMKGHLFTLVGVNADKDLKALKKFVENKKLTWPSIFDPKSKLGMRWMALSLPTYFVLDKSHVVRYRGDSFGEAAAVARSLAGAGGGIGNTDAIVSQIFKVYDANKDGRLSKNELSAESQKAFGNADTDGDGTISAKELAKYVKENATSQEVKPDGPK